MRLLTPIGLIGLIGIIILIIIYLIKPNFQNKYISTTYVWQLSLKYKKKRIPTSKLRNIILIICQILILTILSLVLAYPVLFTSAGSNGNEVVAILDSSASMRTKENDITRYEKAVEKIKEKAIETFAKGDEFSLIIADENPSYVYTRAKKENEADVIASLDELINVSVGEDIKCSYGSADIEGSIYLTEEILLDNSNAEVFLYTGKRYSYIPNSINVVDVRIEDEWNVGILNAYTEYVDNYYDIIVDLASYGRDNKVGISIDITGVNPTPAVPEGTSIHLDEKDYEVNCAGDETTHVYLKSTGANNIEETENAVVFDISKYEIYTYSEITVTIVAEDSLVDDNTFLIYGGKKETIKIQYYSSEPNPFVSSVLFNLANVYSQSYNIVFSEAKGGVYEKEGFDYYIFEHEMPSSLPTDGVVILLDPKSTIKDAGFKYDGLYTFPKESYIVQDVENNPLLRNLQLDKISVHTVCAISNIDTSYTVLASCNNYPVLMVKDEGASKVFVMNFSVHYSNLPIRLDMPFLFNNIFKHFTPKIIDSNAYGVHDDVVLNTRGEEMTIYRTDSPDDKYIVTEFPASYNVSTPGVYVIEQETYYGDQITENIFVKIPKEESNIFVQYDSLQEPSRKEQQEDIIRDILFYIAIALTALVLLEWVLKGRES